MRIGPHLLRLCAASCLAAALLSSPRAHGVEPEERLADPALEARARTLSTELRCLVCQNQSIDESNADLAHDLRVLIRERIAAGSTDPEILAFMVKRYGDFILLRPPVEPATYGLWLGPFLVLILGAGAAILYLRRHQPDAATSPADAPLSEDEQVRLAKLLSEDTAR